MTERNELVRDAFLDDTLGQSDRDRLWSTMQHRKTRQARLRNLVRAAALLLAAAILAAVMFLRLGVRSTAGPVAVAADSLTTNSPSEPSMIQEPKEAALTNLIPLLGHRSSLRSTSPTVRRAAMNSLNVSSKPQAREHDRVEQELAAVEQQLEASRVAISVIDAQLASSIPAPPVGTNIVPPPVIPPLSDELIWTSGGPLVLLALGMIAMLGYMRRIARKTREALHRRDREPVSSQHATLASGIDAIALEVKRVRRGATVHVEGARGT